VACIHPWLHVQAFYGAGRPELKKRWPQQAINDAGFFSLPGSSHRFRDWKAGGHGVVDLHKSLVVSCDTYYYGLANDLGIDNIFNFTSQFGLGKKTGIDIEGEVAGLLPSQDWKMKRHKQKWYAGDTISVGIGQGYNLATPLQLAFATAILAGNGTAFRPHLVKKVLDNNNEVVREIATEPLYSLNLSAANLATVRNALIDVTGRAAPQRLRAQAQPRHLCRQDRYFSSDWYQTG
jgi:penicillin-binding protein 2